MGILSTAIIAFSMSTDAFAVSVGRGAAEKKQPLSHALRTGAIFGAVEGITPVIGWLLGLAASAYVEAVDHWIAFIILSAIGLKMIRESFANAEVSKPRAAGLGRLVLTAIGTSIDSLAGGISLSVLGAPIGVTAAAIGFATFSMVTIGLMAGQYLGAKFGKYAEMAGGCALVFLGTKILLEHLGHI